MHEPTNIKYKIAIWNSNGLDAHKYELESFLKLMKIDIMLISETHMTDKSYVKFQGFTTYDTKHPDNRAHGGSAIIIRNNIAHHKLNKFSTNYIQATSVQLENNNQPLTITSVYSPPRHKIDKTMYKDFF